MAPEIPLVLAFILLTMAAYYLWATDQAPLTRSLLSLLAFVCFLLAFLARTYVPPGSSPGGLP